MVNLQSSDIPARWPSSGYIPAHSRRQRSPPGEPVRLGSRPGSAPRAVSGAVAGAASTTPRVSHQPSVPRGPVLLIGRFEFLCFVIGEFQAECVDCLR